MKLLQLLLILSSAVLLSSCAKWTNPKKVDRIITKDSWRVTLFYAYGDNLESQFANVRLGFGDEGSLTVLDTQGVSGTWSLSLDNKPTTLYLSTFQDEPYFFLNDDWEVKTCSKQEITLESQNGTFINKLTLTKVIQE